MLSGSDEDEAKIENAKCARPETAPGQHATSARGDVEQATPLRSLTALSAPG